MRRRLILALTTVLLVAAPGHAHANVVTLGGYQANSASVGNSGPVAEGTTATVSFSGVVDPSAPDTAAGFHYAYDFDGDGTWELGGATYATSVTAPSATVPAALL